MENPTISLLASYTVSLKYTPIKIPVKHSSTLLQWSLILISWYVGGSKADYSVTSVVLQMIASLQVVML